MKSRILCAGVIVLIVSFLFADAAFAAKKPKKKTVDTTLSNQQPAPAQKKEEPTVVSSTTKNVNGEVSAVNNNFISVIYNRDLSKHSQDEICIPIGAGLAVEHKKDISQIAIGDTVDVKYEESVVKDKEGNKSSKRAAKVVTFLKAGEKKAESTALDSETATNKEE